MSGLSIAARLAEARPGSTVLLVAVELCTLAFRLDEFTKAFSALNAAVLAVRIKAEDEALARRGGVGASSG